MEVAEDLTAEADGLAKEIERQRAAGIPYSEQAILCRSHTYLGRVGAELERVGVPVLYLGNLFERPEVRDMLSLLSLACEPDGRGLVRVARFPEYDVPFNDVILLLELAREPKGSLSRRVEFSGGGRDHLYAGQRAAHPFGKPSGWLALRQALDTTRALPI